MFRDKIRPYLYIAPTMLVILTFTVFPIFYLIYLSMRDYNLMNPSMSKFIGAQNYVSLLQKASFLKSLKVTSIYTVSILVIEVIFAVLLAIYLKKGTQLNRLTLGGSFIPHVISIVSISMIWMSIFDPEAGIANRLLKMLGLPPSQFLQSSATALATVIFIAAWKGIGHNAVITAGSLQSIPNSVYEAASLDNAKPFTVLRKITLPMISPQLFVIIITIIMGSFKVFDSVNIMTGGGPNKATTTLVYFIYQYRSSNIGYASTAGVILMAILAVLSIIYFKLLSKKVHYQ